MKIVFTLLLCIIGFVAIDRSVDANKTDCDKKTFDRCNERLFMIGDDTFVFPMTIPEMNKRCKELKPLEACTRSYSSKCLSSETKQSISVLTYGVTKANKGYCTSNKKKQAFIKMTTCVAKNKRKFDQAMWQMASDFKAIAVFTQEKMMKIPLACCNYYKFKNTCMAIMIKECTPDETTEFESLVDNYAVDMLNLLCGDFTAESDKCSIIMFLTPKWTKKHPSKVFVLPLVDLLNTL